VPASPDPWPDDEALIADLREALAEEGRVGDQEREAARAALTWRTVDAELMRLTHDSLFADHSLVRSTGTAPPRVLAFEASGFSLELELDEGTLTGQLLPGSPATVAVAGPRGPQVRVEADGDGFFTVGGVSGGRVRFQVTLEGQTHTSEWVTL
jgi:hypothetical protein